MRYDQSFRDSRYLSTLLQAIRQKSRSPIRIMEVCGGQTHALSQYRIEELLPPTVQMIHGPGCPVCVTPEETLSEAIAIARTPGTILCTFGDMMRVPGNNETLQQIKAEGADIRIVYSPLDSLHTAVENRDKQVVFLAVGFETTAPLYTLLLHEITARHIDNLSLLTSLFTIPAAISFLAQEPDCGIDGVLAAGHVCSISGLQEYERLSEELQIPIAVTGFEPTDLLFGIYRVIEEKEQGNCRVVNAYRRAVPHEGNPMARQETARFFVPCESNWRGLGIIPNSGLKLRPQYEQYDAHKRFACNPKSQAQPSVCRVGDIMKGKISPCECPLFGNRCTPDNPLGASMVSSEGACAAFFRYRTPLKSPI